MPAGKEGFAKALLQLRGDLTDPFNAEELAKIQDVLGPVTASSLARARVNMAFGSAKEGFALEAGVRALQHELPMEGLIVRETGFMSCNVEGERCACFVCIVCVIPARPLPSRPRMCSCIRASMPSPSCLIPYDYALHRPLRPSITPSLPPSLLSFVPEPLLCIRRLVLCSLRSLHPWARSLQPALDVK